MAEAEDASASWVTLSAAASLTGRHIDAVRSLVRRRKLPARKNNSGQWLVQVPPAAAVMAQSGAAADTGNGELLAEVAELREALAEARAEAKAARDIADARVDAANAAVAALRELSDRLTAELADVRRPWWRRMFG